MATVQTLQQCTTGPDIGISPALYRCISPNCLFRCPHSGTRQHTWATGLLVKHFDLKQSLFQNYCVHITFVYFGACLGCLVLIILHTLFAYSERGNQPLELILDYSWNITNFRETSHNSRFFSSGLFSVLYFGSDSYRLPNFILALAPNLIFVHIHCKMIQICNFDNIHENSGKNWTFQYQSNGPKFRSTDVGISRREWQKSEPLWICGALSDQADKSTSITPWLFLNLPPPTWKCIYATCNISLFVLGFPQNQKILDFLDFLIL